MRQHRQRYFHARHRRPSPAIKWHHAARARIRFPQPGPGRAGTPQDPRPGQRRWQEAVPAEGHRPRGRARCAPRSTRGGTARGGLAWVAAAPEVVCRAAGPSAPALTIRAPKTAEAAAAALISRWSNPAAQAAATAVVAAVGRPRKEPWFTSRRGCPASPGADRGRSASRATGVMVKRAVIRASGFRWGPTGRGTIPSYLLV